VLGAWWRRDAGGLVAARLAAAYWAQGSAALGARWWHDARCLVATRRDGWGWSQGQGGRVTGRLGAGVGRSGSSWQGALGSGAGRDAAT
jgi:hypothetical protein